MSLVRETPYNKRQPLQFSAGVTAEKTAPVLIHNKETKWYFQSLNALIPSFSHQHFHSK